MDIDIKTAEEALRPSLDHAREPLANLREDICSTTIKEYQPTGDTPQKLVYEYPTELPRTQAHASLIAKLNGEPSPSKAAVFADAGLALLASRSPSRPATSDSVASADRSRNGLATSLREVHPNVNNSNNSNNVISGFDLRPSATSHSLSASAGRASLLGAGDDEAEDMAMPLLKKTRTTRGRVSKSTLSVEGRENLPPLATMVPGGGKEIFSQSISRRKSPRLN